MMKSCRNRPYEITTKQPTSKQNPKPQTQRPNQLHLYSGGLVPHFHGPYGSLQNRNTTTTTPPHSPLPHNQNENVSYSSHLPRRSTTILLTLLLLLLSSFLYLFWPSDPSLRIVRLKLTRLHVHTRPRVIVDVCMEVRIKVQNVDVYSMEYDELEVGVGYRGKKLGQVRFQQGNVRAFGSSYVDAEAEFTGVRVFSDVVLLLEDLAKGRVPFDTVMEVQGKLGVLVFHFPLQARVSCEILVSMVNQTILRHNCYEVRRSKMS